MNGRSRTTRDREKKRHELSGATEGLGKTKTGRSRRNAGLPRLFELSMHFIVASCRSVFVGTAFEGGYVILALLVVFPIVVEVALSISDWMPKLALNDSPWFQFAGLEVERSAASARLGGCLLCRIAGCS